MKKYLYCTIFLFLSIIQCLSADNIDLLIDKYSSLPNVSVFSIDSTFMEPGESFDWLVKMPIKGNIDSLTVINLSACEENLKLDFQKDFQSYNDEENNETILNLDEQGDVLRLINRKKDGWINDIVIFMINAKRDAIVVRIFGKIESIDPSQLTR